MVVMDTVTQKAAAALNKYCAAVTVLCRDLRFLEKIWRDVLRGRRRCVSRRNVHMTRTLEEMMCQTCVKAMALRQGIESLRVSFCDADGDRLRAIDRSFDTVSHRSSNFTKKLKEHSIVIDDGRCRARGS